MTAPRSANGVVTTASNSAFSQPAPIPTVSLPPDKTSIVANCLAASTAGRCGTTSTASTSRSRAVEAASQAAKVNISWRWALSIE